MSVGAFARRSRLSMKALRLYERVGLLRPVQIQNNGYRRYRESQLATARLISMLRRLDMPLVHVAQVVAAAGPQGAEVSMLRQQDDDIYAASANGLDAAQRAAQRVALPAAAELVAVYWQSVEQRVASQRELAMHLRTRLLGVEGGLMTMYTIQQRDVPEQLVLTEQRHILVADLPNWLGEAFGRLMGSAARYGGPCAPAFAVYHGEVNQESDGPVEVCVPINPADGPSTDVPMRREPAHREAYVRITRAQVQYPQILSAFDAVAEWLSIEGISASAPPREIYFADFMAAAPTDEVCDVAFPIN
jgi:DNA-binding transcriptional MerR regulator